MLRRMIWEISLLEREKSGRSQNRQEAIRPSSPCWRKPERQLGHWQMQDSSLSGCGKDTNTEICKSSSMFVYLHYKNFMVIFFGFLHFLNWFKMCFCLAFREYSCSYMTESIHYFNIYPLYYDNVTDGIHHFCMVTVQNLKKNQDIWTNIRKKK